MASISSYPKDRWVANVLTTLLCAGLVALGGLFWTDHDLLQKHDVRITAIERTTGSMSNIPADLAATKASLDDVKEQNRRIDAKLDRLLESQAFHGGRK